MLTISKGAFEKKMDDIIRDNYISLSVPVDHTVISLRLNFNQIDYINDYMTHLYLMIESLSKNWSLGFINHNERIFKKLDKEYESDEIKYDKVSTSMFINKEKSILLSVSLSCNLDNFKEMIEKMEDKIITLAKFILKKYGW